ncbi:MAG: TPM domain-containing protein [Nibricoccus sp.]
MSRFTFWIFLVALIGSVTLRAETLPPKPARHFNDYARLVSNDTVRQLDARLAQFERETTNQIVVAIFPKMESRSSVEDFTVRTAQSWGVGQKVRNNGAVLFIFVQDRQAYIQVGYGLEGALPDALCFQIIDQQLKPRFRNNDYAGGVTATVDSLIAATRGEYKAVPTHRSAAQNPGPSSSKPSGLIILLVLVFVISGLKNTFGRRGRVRRSSGGWFIGGGGGGGSSWGGGGGGGFSGGGGSFGGGGAGGKW